MTHVDTSNGSDPKQRLLGRINELGGQDAHPVVPLDLFFEGNDDEGSFAPNLEPHPGMVKIYSALRAIKDRDDVDDVLVQIDEVDLEPFWPYASGVYVITKATAAEVYGWAQALEPDDPEAVDRDNYGWLAYGDRDRSTPPPRAPALPDGYRSVILFWD